MSEHPHWYTAQQSDATWNEADAARFDGSFYGYKTYPGTTDPKGGPKAYPGQPVPDAATIPPLNPNQPTPEQIADAARFAFPNIETVIRLWPYPQFDIDGLLDLYRLLRGPMPAPAWQAKDDNE